MTPPVELIPAQRQRLWGWQAVANFTLGGVGAGLYGTAVMVAGFERGPAVALASWLAPLLVLAGFVAVAGEAGRPLRGPRVLWKVRTSWMSRELWIGGIFVLLVAADIAFPLRLHRAQALAAAVLLALAQGMILRRSRGIAAWDAAVMPWLFLLSAAVSGAGAYMLLEVLAGRTVPPAVLTAGILLVILTFWAGRAYVSTPAGHAFRDATASLRGGAAGRLAAGLGGALPLGALAVALASPPAAATAAALAGLAMVAGQAYVKTELIVRAGLFRPITVPTLRMSRRLS
ncbi:MAG: DmsC/YnfH family molybdoenzyme membrane anchor subunit [Candidatus Rokubacteria bacterium]|nr:DmsC/YnfH family molybdoenzyme membrane anchor subunit [Candidatus Rokubacteria bacterium]